MFFPVLAMILVGGSWSVTGYVMGKGPKKNMTADALVFYACLFSLVVSVASGLCAGLPQTTRAGIAIVAVSQLGCGIANYFQLVLMADAMQKGPNGVVWSVLQAGFVFPFFMGICFFGVPLTPLRLFGFLAVLFSLFLYCWKGESQKNAQYGKWLLPTLLAFLATGGSQLCQNIPSYYPEANVVSSMWRQAFYCIGSILCFLLCGLGKPRELYQKIIGHGRRLDAWGLVVLMEGVSLPVTYFLLFPGMDALARLNAGAVAFPIMVSSCIIVFELFSLIVLKEKRTLFQRLALVFCIAGVIALSAQ